MQKSFLPPLLVARATSRIFQATSKCGLVAGSARDARWAPEPRMRLRSGPQTRHGLGPEAPALWARKRLWAGPQRRSLAGPTDRSKRFRGLAHERLWGSARECLRPSLQALSGPACERLRAQPVTR